MLFWCRVSRVLLRSSVVALLSMLRKRSMAEMLRWMLCFGMSNLDTKVKVPPSSKLNSIGQQSWPWWKKNPTLGPEKRQSPLKYSTTNKFQPIKKLKALTAATMLFSETKVTLRRARYSVFNWLGLQNRSVLLVINKHDGLQKVSIHKS